MANLEKMCPQAIFGFSNELATLFRNDLNGFLNKRFQHTEGMNSSLNS